MKLNDGRLPADIAKNLFGNKNIIIHSDGTPTRTFCYVADAIVGYLKVLSYKKFEIFNIGHDQGEINVKEFAKNIFRYVKKNLIKKV